MRPIRNDCNWARAAALPFAAMTQNRSFVTQLRLPAFFRSFSLAMTRV